MGIKGLFKLISTESPNAIRASKDFKGQKIAIDASILIYQWCIVGESRNIVNSYGMYINHIQGTFFRTVSMLVAGIIPVFVFDGPPPKIKDATIAKRKLTKQVNISRNITAEVILLLHLMGVMTVQAPSEAESEAASMSNNGSVAAVASEDGDVLAFGGQALIRGLGVQGEGTVVETALVLKGLGLSRASFIDLCILLGCDYTGTVPKIGPKRALLLMRKYGSIEALLAGENIIAPANFNYQEARKEFTRPQVSKASIMVKTVPLTTSMIDSLYLFLVDTHGLPVNKVETGLKKLSTYYGL